MSLFTISSVCTFQLIFTSNSLTVSLIDDETGDMISKVRLEIDHILRRIQPDTFSSIHERLVEDINKYVISGVLNILNSTDKTYVCLYSKFNSDNKLIPVEEPAVITSNRIKYEKLASILKILIGLSTW